MKLPRLFQHVNVIFKQFKFFAKNIPFYPAVRGGKKRCFKTCALHVKNLGKPEINELKEKTKNTVFLNGI